MATNAVEAVADIAGGLIERLGDAFRVIALKPERVQEAAEAREVAAVEAKIDREGYQFIGGANESQYLTAWGFRRSRRLFPGRIRAGFRDEPEHHRSDAGNSIVRESVRLRQEEPVPERSGGRTPLAAKGYRGKAAGLAPPSAGETRSAISAPLRTLPIIRQISFPAG